MLFLSDPSKQPAMSNINKLQLTNFFSIHQRRKAVTTHPSLTSQHRFHPRNYSTQYATMTFSTSKPNIRVHAIWQKISRTKDQ
ncbi:Protein of unknown function [Pyronema omphalodes CBS 100304]|uniref:Uncharacterized protein n=1 Tax=Pyronema omphalodes (strain CBS 100304) TaxID=1076935 RepID=U4LKJ9_PYROM|nr:Protein of unknown function [Pyronema omphalodes CBS 100304]